MLGFVMTFIHAKSRLMSPRRAVVFLLPILGLSIISCGGDSGLSSQGSEEEFCYWLYTQGVFPSKRKSFYPWIEFENPEDAVVFQLKWS
jgi:hypothetical protein